MPTTHGNLGQSPVNSDTFNLTGDMSTLVDSLEVIVPVASQAAGDTVATARASAGFAVSDARPLFIYNTTSRTIQVKDSSGWRDLNFPLGLMSQNNVTSASGAVGTTITVINNIASFTFKANRHYKLTWVFEYNGSVAGNYADMSINTCATTDGAAVTTGLTKLNGSSLKILDAGIGIHGDVTAYFTSGVDTTLQIKFTTFIWSGAGNVTISASSTQPARYSIVDEGLAF